MKKIAIVSLHLAYWLLYAFILLMIWGSDDGYVGMPVRPPGWVFNVVKLYAFMLFLSPLGVGFFWPALLGFYSFYFVLFDRFLARRKIKAFLIAALLVLISTPLFVGLVHVMSWPQHPFSLLALVCNAPVMLIVLGNGVVALAMKGFISWFADIKVKAELKKKNYEMELGLLKAQINPHFLFNTINNIDLLIRKDAEKASDYLNKLSDIMRFMLYEAGTEKISLTKELAYIEKYIALQKIRTTNANYVSYDVKGNGENVYVEPMLFIPFIENAFKHSENKKMDEAIKISFTVGGNKIKFECENAHPEGSTLKPDLGGLGNNLIVRRLALLYPDQHDLKVNNENGLYKVVLIINVL